MKRFSYRQAESAFVNVAYDCPFDAAAISFDIRDSVGRPLYFSRYPVFPNMPNRFPSLKAGFPADYLEETVPDPRLKGDVQLTWQHGLRDYIMTPNALARGYAYNVEDWWQYFKDTHQVLLVPHPSYWGGSELETYAAAARAHGVAVALMPTAAAAGKGIPYPPGLSHQLFYADPKAQDAYLAAMKNGLREYGDIVRYIYFGDEFEDALTTTAIYLWQQRRDDYPFIRTVNDEIKRKYGFGKYGIPERSNYRFQFEPIEQFHWLALRRWVADFTAEFAGRVRDEARKIKPDILMISPDPKAGNRPQYYERWRGLFDLATFQVYLKPTPLEEMFAGASVKLIRDLGGVPHVWPCLHMESLGAIYSPDEVREVLSQTFIAGSTGMHTWPIPGRGSIPIDRIDAPARQAMFEQFGEYVSAGLRARQEPSPAVALLYSNDSCASHADEYGIPQPPKAYRYLSDGCAVNFRWIGDLGMELGHDRLDNYRVLIVPVAHIIRKVVSEKTLAAVRSGLNLIVLQPESFSINLDGTSTENLASAMRSGAGLERRETPVSGFVGPDPSCGLLKGIKTDRLPVMGDDFRYRFTDLTPYRKTYTFRDIPKNGEIVLRYDDGAPAAIRVKVGKGTVLWLGFNPLLGVYSTEWTEFFRAVLRSLDVALDRPAGRLLLPLEYRMQSEDVVYLTGNGCSFECSIPQVTRSVYLPGSYRYTLTPDQVKDVASETTPISFSTGKLTDRAHPAAQAYVTFKKTEAFSVEFDLAAVCPARRVDLYCAEFIPQVTLAASVDGQDFRVISRAEESGQVSGVRQIRLAFPAPLNSYRYFRLDFGPRPAGKELTISEVDILGPAG